jgi:hypothetical protein
MGIVVTVSMLLGLLIVSPFSLCSFGRQRENKTLASAIAGALFFMGLWNTVWYGLQNSQYFWGMAALVSGVFMMLVAVQIMKKYGVNALSSNAVVTAVNQKINPLSLLWIAGLFLSFLLYAVTLIQLNLGFAIIH